MQPHQLQASDRFTTAVVVGDSWSNSCWDWPGYTTELHCTDYRIHAISGDWLSARDVVTNKGIVLNIDEYLDLNPEADSLIVMAGVNDIINDVDAATLKSAMQTVIAEAKSRSNIKNILMISPGAFGGVPSGWSETKQTELEDYINWLPGYAQSEQIDFLNIYELVNHPDYPWIISDGTNGAPDYTNDGLHITPPGMEVVAEAIDTKVAEIRARPITIAIDVAPWDAANEVRPNASYLLAVSVLSSSVSLGHATDFDAQQVDPSTLKFGINEAPNVSQEPLVQDINGDSLTDVIIGFRMEETDIQCADVSVDLNGETYSGASFEGSDLITTVDCETNECHP